MSYDIIYVKGHYEVRDENGNFITSGDSYGECRLMISELCAA